MKTLVIVPCFNEASNIVALIEDIKSYGYDYLVINDSSTDNTLTILKEHHYHYLDLVNNVGIAGVTQIGFKYAADHDYDCAVCIDGDGQHPPKYIHTLISAIGEGYDYIVGSRFITDPKPWTMRMLGSRLLCGLIHLKSGQKVTDPTSGMRALGKKVIKAFTEEMNFYAEPDALCHLLRSGYKVREVPVTMMERTQGESYFHNPLKSIRYMFGVIMSLIFIQ